MRLFARSANYNVNWIKKQDFRSRKRTLSRVLRRAQKRNRGLFCPRVKSVSPRRAVNIHDAAVSSLRTKARDYTKEAIMRTIGWSFDKGVIKTKITGGSWIVRLYGEERIIDLLNMFRNIRANNNPLFIGLHFQTR